MNKKEAERREKRAKDKGAALPLPSATNPEGSCTSLAAFVLQTYAASAAARRRRRKKPAKKHQNGAVNKRLIALCPLVSECLCGLQEYAQRGKAEGRR